MYVRDTPVLAYEIIPRLSKTGAVDFRRVRYPKRMSLSLPAWLLMASHTATGRHSALISAANADPAGGDAGSPKAALVGNGQNEMGPHH